MKGRSLLLVAVVLAAGSGCTRPGVNRSLPLEIQSAVSGQGAEEFVASLKSEAYANARFRPAKASDGDRTVVMTVRSIVGPVEPGGRPGFTYLVDWSRNGTEIGAVEADCVIGHFAYCANIAVDILARQLGPGRR